MMPNSILASAHRLFVASSTIAAALRLALVLGFTTALALSNPTSAAAQTQTYPCETVMQFGTGVSTSGTKLRPGSVDPSFQGTDATFPDPPNAYVLTDPPAKWIVNSASADSQWIGPSSTIDDDIAGTSVYRLLIVSPCDGATLTGRYAALYIFVTPQRFAANSIAGLIFPSFEGGVQRIISLQPAMRAGTASIKTVEKRGAEPPGM